MDAESLIPLMAFVSLGLAAFSWWTDRKKKSRMKDDIDKGVGEDAFESRAKDIYDEQKRR